MKKTSETVVFFGNERLATGVKTTSPTLQALIAEGYNVAAVVSNFEVGQSRNARQLEIKDVADKHGIPVLLPPKLIDITDNLRGLRASIGVLVAYGKIVPQSIIDLFPRGIVNIHPSLLPLHRGPTPLESVILSGEDKTGVSIMKLVKDMDAGPVYGRSELILKGTESKQELADKLLDIGQSMITELLPGIIDGSVIAMPQDNSRATYDSLISKDAGWIDWEKPAEQIEREIRAYIGWPKSRTKLGGKEVIITKAYVVASMAARAKPGDLTIVPEANALAVATSNGSLWIQQLKPAGKREMSAKEFLAGYGHLFK
jgi:methionyl-tRNA formyltransferase